MRGTWRRFSLTLDFHQMQLLQITMLVDVHRESALLASAAYQDGRRQKPWGSCLCELSRLHLALKARLILPPVCFFLTFAGRWGRFAWSSMLAKDAPLFRGLKISEYQSRINYYPNSVVLGIGSAKTADGGVKSGMCGGLMRQVRLGVIVNGLNGLSANNLRKRSSRILSRFRSAEH